MIGIRAKGLGPWAPAALLLLAAWLPVGCGGGGGTSTPAPPARPYTEVVSQLVAPELGAVLEVSLPGSSLAGLRLTIPPGALAAETRIIIGVAHSPLDPGGNVFATAVLEPAGLSFNSEVTLSMPYVDTNDDGLEDDSGLDARGLAVYKLGAGVWVELPSRVDTGRKRVSARITGFSSHTLRFRGGLRHQADSTCGVVFTGRDLATGARRIYSFYPHDPDAVSSLTPYQFLVDDEQPALNPDRTRAVFVRTTAQGVSNLARISCDGTGLAFITNNDSPAVRYLSPRFGPDGETVVFASNLNGAYDIYMSPVTGFSPARLTSHAANELGPFFSPDGGTVYFHRQEGYANIFAVDTATLEVEQLTEYDNTSVRNPAVNRAGDRLLMEWIYSDHDSGQERPPMYSHLLEFRLDNLTASPFLQGGDYFHPRYSADDREVIYSDGRQLYRIGADGGSPALIALPTVRIDYFAHPDW